MPISSTEAMKEAYAKAPTDIQTVDTIVLDHSLFPFTLRFVRSEFDMSLQGNTYLGRQFKYSLPEVSAKSNTGVNITVTDIDRTYIQHIDNAVQTTEPITLLFNTWIIGTYEPQAGFDNALESKSISLKNGDLVMSAGYPDLVNLKIPRARYTTEEFPGLR